MHEIETLAEFNNIIRNNRNVVVDFFADWCGPCKMIAPYFEELSNKYKNIYFCKVNVDIDEIASVCDVTSLPTFLFYNNQENVDELIGANKEKLGEKLNELDNL
jgi:thioredoxin 1